MVAPAHIFAILSITCASALPLRIARADTDSSEGVIHNGMYVRSILPFELEVDEASSVPAVLAPHLRELLLIAV